MTAPPRRAPSTRKPPNGQPAAPVAAQPAARRLTLADITSPTHDAPDGLPPTWVNVIGPTGVGKTTFAAGAPNPFFIFSDRKGKRSIGRSTKSVCADGWDRLPGGGGGTITVMETLRMLVREDHGYRSVVIDTISRAQFFLWKWLCALYEVKSIELVGGGYGKGFTAAVEQIEEMITLLFALGDKGMHVIVISQQETKSAANPLGEEYEKFALQLNQKAAGALLAAADDNLFVEPQILSKAVEKKGDRVKYRGGQTGVMKVYTRPRVGVDAKNRDFLPPEMVFSWAVFEREAIKGGELREALFTRLATLDSEQRAQADEYLSAHGWSREAAEKMIANIGEGGTTDLEEEEEEGADTEPEEEESEEQEQEQATETNQAQE